MPEELDTASTLKQLEKRVEELEAVRDITRLRAEFHRSLNNREWDTLAGLFTDDAHLDYGEYGQAHGSREVRDYYGQLLEQIRDMRNATAILLKNFIHGHQVHLQGENTATGVCFFEEQIRFNQDSHAFSSIGQFSDKYVRIGDRWYFAKVELDHYWVVPDNDGWRWPW
ncbi:SnoaL-like domain-containing protein [Thermomonospora echinospora]|uniref:SnoaL-like domain-containing protein n=1 Tax=Thermomonospora echinospora TaxID=1992 RepID=A0A1H6D9B2_9ACTN|nr:nuclear transport factor 2 family protein [Thermomonospora echinospora]SEG81235.1 SnoaL-like domain-containing protein [Thermomonospora echinospora]